MPSSAKQFLPFVREKFPRLAKLYEDWYRKNGYARNNTGEKLRSVWRGYGRSMDSIRVRTTKCIGRR